MLKIVETFKKHLYITNWDGLRCIIKGDANIRETMGALSRQQEIDRSALQNTQNNCQDS